MGAKGRHILVVEDDDALRVFFAKTLRSRGYDVEEASTGWEAMEAFERGCPDLLLADLIIPGPNGQELANACRERCPETVLVFVSGHTAEKLQELAITQVVFLPKPLARKTLLQTIERLLGPADPGE
jgi:two-component system, cell cycle sensor histidine kinase and response regulator CckA